jgi:vanillate O-demethylase monooxygenase subunit
MRDLCIHRGTALSLGWIADDCIVCPYHAWRYDVTGACVRIPQSAHATIPVKARTPVYRCQERYGLIWVCLAEAEPAYAVPEVPELESESWKVVKTGPFEWATDASRQVENFTDFGHFPWVHPGLLGDPERPVVPDHQVETAAHAALSGRPPEAANSDDFPVFANEQTDRPVRRSRYELHLPTRSRCASAGAAKGMVYFFASQPVAANAAAGSAHRAQLRLRRPGRDAPEVRGRHLRTGSARRRIAASGAGAFRSGDELHSQFDAVAIAYRKAMQTERLRRRPSAESDS